jgi:hypothetical protein
MSAKTEHLLISSAASAEMENITMLGRRKTRVLAGLRTICGGGVWQRRPHPP